jgi:hypothetical protein
MGNGERSGSGGGLDWRVRLATGVGICAGSAVALALRPNLRALWPVLTGFWPGLIAFCAFAGAGGVLGRLVGGLLSQPPPGGPPDHPPHA